MNDARAQAAVQAQPDDHVPDHRVRAAVAFPTWLVVCGWLAVACNAQDDRPAAWEYLSPVIFQPNCATSSCHSRAAAVSGLDFSDPDRGYISLTQLWVWIVDPSGTPEQGCLPMNGKVLCQRNHRPLVTAFDPAQSRVVNMLRAQSAPRMPPDRTLPEADIRLVEKWILNGAARTVGGPPAPGGALVDAANETSGDSTVGDGSTADAPTEGPRSTDALDANRFDAAGSADGSADGIR